MPAAGLAGAAEGNVDVVIDAADYGWVFCHCVLGILGGQTALGCRITYRTHPRGQPAHLPKNFRTGLDTLRSTPLAWFAPTCSQYLLQ